MALEDKNKNLPATIDGEVKKAHEAVAITPKSGESLTLLGRKMYNIMLHHAQKQGATKPRYRVALKEITTTAEFDSHDTGLIKRYLKQMAATTVEWYSSGDKGRSWEVTSLISSAKLEEEHGIVYISWAYDESIKSRLLAPEMYARISLQLQSQFRSASALALYEIGQRYADNPGKVTMRNQWEWWRPVLTGTPDAQSNTYLEYKYFKRDVIKPSLRELNAVADIKMELIEHKNGRKVTDLQFSVERNLQSGLPLEDMNLLDMTLLSRVMALGITQKEAESIYSKTDEAILRATVDNTEARLKRNPPVSSAAAYFKDAIKKGYIKPAKAALPKPGEKPEAKDNRNRMMQALISKRRIDAEVMFNEMDNGAQQSSISKWLKEAPETVRKNYAEKKLSHKIASVNFYTWLSLSTWGEPTESDLLDFILNNQQD